MHKMTLITQAQAGQEDAFDQILTAYHGLIWNLYRRYQHAMSNDEWLQESRVVLYQTLCNLQLPHWGALTAYYQRALYHRMAQDWRKSNQTVIAVVDQTTDVVVEQPIGQASTVEEVVLPHLLLTTMQRRLSHKEAQFLTLRLAGYDMAECATVLKMSRSWCYATRQTLKMQYLLAVKGG